MSNESWGPPQPPARPAGGWPPGGWPPPPQQPPPPPRPPPRRTHRGLVVALGLGLAVVLAGTIGVVSLLTRPDRSSVVTAGRATAPAPPPTTGASSPSANSSATAALPSQPTKAAPTPRKTPGTEPAPRTPNTSMKSNALYGINLSGQDTCQAKVRRPKPALKNSKLAPYLRTLVDCMVDVFRAPLAKAGFTLAKPQVKTFESSVKTPCGTLRSNSNPAFYCSGTIYWPVSSDDAREAYTFARMGYVGLTAHEFGHHLQATTGLLNGYAYSYAEAGTKSRYQLSRRLELQAQCFEGVFLAQTRKSIKLSSRDRSEIRAWHSYTGDEDPPSSRNPDHGTSKAQVRWLERGLDGADFGRCNTWSASTAAVK